METELRRAVLSRLNAGGETRFGRPYFVSRLRREVGCSESEVLEVLWGLVGDGLAYLDPSGQGSSTDNWHWRLSSRGLRAAEGGSWEPQDVDGYLARLQREIPDLDRLVKLYLVEALRSFEARTYLAASVMLGVAAERAFLVMANSYAGSNVPGSTSMAKELARPRSNYFGLWTEFRKRIEPVRQTLPDGLADPLTLDAVADLIRLTRNEVGHPTGRIIDEDTARIHLTIAPMYLQKMRKLTYHFARNPLQETA
ncbi:hypothetical protein FHW23_003443 [Curtobacterium pusillum]|uniref:DUF4145 domain-containing protein n=1 Tax=Curtobacterium pusillum TaxID=69373 RepID=A0AAW3TCF5_9MICO|nr:hypothetical protein [Curtobacterium pusillum]MBA8992155.1 hypothetical protein [Curtobacterium pusillum]